MTDGMIAGGERAMNQRPLAFVRAIGFAVTLLGVAVLAAWIFGLRLLIPVGLDVPGMTFNTALSFVFCGPSLIYGTFSDRRSQRLSGLLALLPLVLAGFQLLELFEGEALGVQQFFSQFLASPALLAEFKGGVSPNTSVAFLVFCATQTYLGLVDRRVGATAYTTGGLIVSALGLISVVGYFFNVDFPYQWRDYAGMALHTAIGISLLGIAFLTHARQPQNRNSSTTHFFVSSALCIVGLLFDLGTPAYLGSNIIYIPVVLSSLWFTDRRMSFYFAFICSLFSVLAFLAKVEVQDVMFQRGVSRGFGVMTLFIVATLIYYFKIAMQQMEVGKRRFEALMDNSPDAVVTINDKGTVHEFNPAAEAMFGYGEADVIGRNVNLLMPEPYFSGHDDYLKNYAETGKKQIIGTIREVTGKRKDGSTFPLDLSVSVLSAAGAEKQFVGIIRDLTNRKRQEETLRQALNRLATYTSDLERSNQELDEFAYIASHDLKEPLRGLHNHSRFLLEDYDTVLDSDGKRRLNRLLFLTQRMEKLVNDLLYFSRIGRQELAVKPTDINLVIRDILSTIDQLIEERNAKVKINGTLPTVTCDATRITEVFRNLIINGIKYNDKAERLVEIGFLDQHVDDQGVRVDKVFYVRDNGKGIAPEFHQDIFRIFKRLEKAESKEDGTGVGLTFVKKIISRHGGKVWLESKLGSGTTFYFSVEAGQT